MPAPGPLPKLPGPSCSPHGGLSRQLEGLPLPICTNGLPPAPATEGELRPRGQGQVPGLCGRERAMCDQKPRPLAHIWPSYWEPPPACSRDVMKEGGS